MAANHQVFSERQRELLAAVLDRIITAEGRLPGAGDLGLAQFIEDVVGRKPRLRRLFTEGLVHIDVIAVQQQGKEFRELSAEARDATLKAVESTLPGFFEELVRQTYNGYYTSPDIFRLIGYDLPLTPTAGYRPELLDPALLEAQRQRAPFWTRV